MGKKKGGRKDWVSVSIRTALYRRVGGFVRGRIDPEIRNRAQFVDQAVREKLEKDGGEESRC